MAAPAARAASTGRAANRDPELARRAGRGVFDGHRAAAELGGLREAHPEGHRPLLAIAGISIIRSTTTGGLSGQCATPSRIAHLHQGLTPDPARTYTKVQCPTPPSHSILRAFVPPYRPTCTKVQFLIASAAGILQTFSTHNGGNRCFHPASTPAGLTGSRGRAQPESARALGSRNPSRRPRRPSRKRSRPGPQADPSWSPAPRIRATTQDVPHCTMQMLTTDAGGRHRAGSNPMTGR